MMINNLKKALQYALVALFLIVLFAVCHGLVTKSGDMQRFSKGLESKLDGGLERTVTLYDYNGNAIRRWTGKIDMSDATDETDFLVNGRRIIIHGGISVVEEKEK